MPVHRVLTEDQLFRDLAVTQPVRDERKHLALIRDGRVRLTEQQQLALLDAVEELACVLIAAPCGGDSLQLAIWHRHARTPALA